MKERIVENDNPNTVRNDLNPSQIQWQDENGLTLGFKDIDAAFNMRDWLQKAVEAKGARKIGGGLGFGGAALEIVLEGHRFILTIKPAETRG